MSIDQALLESDEAIFRNSLVMRFYTWQTPTLSLGYFQSLSDRRTHLPSQPLAVVRRASGGGAIVHHHELTYSISIPRPWLPSGNDAEGLYRSVHHGIIEALADFGVSAVTFENSAAAAKPETEFLCFRRRTAQDLIVSGYKIAGSAQRRSRSRMLQHGSILLSASPFASELPGVNDLGSGRVQATDLARGILNRLSNQWKLPTVHGSLSSDQQNAANRIAEAKFGAQAWTRRR